MYLSLLWRRCQYSVGRLLGQERSPSYFNDRWEKLIIPFVISVSTCLWVVCRQSFRITCNMQREAWFLCKSFICSTMQSNVDNEELILMLCFIFLNNEKKQKRRALIPSRRDRNSELDMWKWYSQVWFWTVLQLSFFIYKLGIMTMPTFSISEL